MVIWVRPDNTICLVNDNFDFVFQQRRDVPRTYCGDMLHSVLQLVCDNVRRKRNASPGPSFPSSSLFTSVYRPSLEEDRFMKEGNQWNYESPIGGQRDRFHKVGFLRVSFFSSWCRKTRVKSFFPLFRNESLERFMLDEMIYWNTLKFAIFLFFGMPKPT